MISSTITFRSSEPAREVMRITKDGITVSPNVAVDEAAAAVIAAMEHHLRRLVEEAVAEEREACVQVCEEKAQQYRDRAARPEGERDIDPEVARVAALTCEFVADAILERGQA